MDVLMLDESYCNICGEPKADHTVWTRIVDRWWLLRVWWLTSRLRQLVGYFSARERARRWHLARMRKLNCDAYCVYHACDMRECPPDSHQ